MKRFMALCLAAALSMAWLTACSGGTAASESASKPNIPPKPDKTIKTEVSETSSTEVSVPKVAGEIYSTGEFQALVPEGWKAFPISDVFSDDNAADTSCFNIIKGGESDLDLFSKPYVRLDYYGPDTQMMKPDKEWYENVEDIEPFQLGAHSWSGFQAEDAYGKMAVLWAEEGDTQYQATIWLEIESEKLSLDDEGVQAILTSAAPSDGTVSNIGTMETPAPEATSSDWWSGYWYGWWAIKNGSGMYQEASDLNLVWDSFAEIQTNGAEFGHITIWDTETSKSFALISGEVAFEPSGEKGIMNLQFGTFFYGNTWLANMPVVPMNLNEGSWRVDPENSTVSHFEDMMEISGHYVSPENPEDSFDYYIYLRPWGTLWEDVRNGDTSGCLYSDMMPLYHDNWYVSLLNLGYEEPVFSFQEGIDIINDYLAGQNGSTNDNGLNDAEKENADGKVDLETLKRCLPWCKTERTYSTTYDEIAALFGVHGKSIESLFEGKSIYRWLADDKNYIQITFDIHDDGSETWNVTQWSGIE